MSGLTTSSQPRYGRHAGIIGIELSLIVLLALGLNKINLRAVETMVVGLVGFSTLLLLVYMQVSKLLGEIDLYYEKSSKKPKKHILVKEPGKIAPKTIPVTPPVVYEKAREAYAMVHPVPKTPTKK
jgi:hypothetical protein